MALQAARHLVSFRVPCLGAWTPTPVGMSAFSGSRGLLGRVCGHEGTRMGSSLRQQAGPCRPTHSVGRYAVRSSDRAPRNRTLQVSSRSTDPRPQPRLSEGSDGWK